jgi:hypothetical protein
MLLQLDLKDSSVSRYNFFLPAITNKSYKSLIKEKERVLKEIAKNTLPRLIVVTYLGKFSHKGPYFHQTLIIKEIFLMDCFKPINT